MLLFCLRLLLLFAIALSAHGNEKTDDGKIRVAITGTDKAVADNIRAHLNLGRLSCDTSERYLNNSLRSADRHISAALRALGYYQASWTLEQQQVARDKGSCWDIAISVVPGEATRITALDISLSGEGRDDPVMLKSLAQAPLKTGDQLNHDQYEEAKKFLLQAARSQGYFDGSFTDSRLEVDRDRNSASIRLNYDTGQRYRIGSINIADTPFNAEFFAGYLKLASGDPFDARKLIQMQNNLINSRYFDQVSVNQGEPDKTDRTVDIDIVLTVKSNYESIYGAGFSTDLGPRVNYQLRNRRFNADGDTYLLSTQLSPVQSQAGFQYQQPGADPVNEKKLWSLGWQQEDNDTYTSESYNAEASRIKRLPSDWVRTTSLTLLAEDFDIADDSDNVVYFFPGIHWQKSHGNNLHYPTLGWYLSTGAKAGLENALSDASFVQLNLNAKFILPLLGGRIIGRSGLGTTFIDEFASLPTTLRYFAGGDNSIRGFDYESLGPTNDEGEVIGGRHLITGSMEYDHPVREDFSLAAFYDTGNAFDDIDFTLHDSVGIGGRWHTPIGTVKVDLAFPLEGGSFRLHLSMGPDL